MLTLATRVPPARMTHTQVTYSTVDCAVVDAATISNACAALTATTVAAYPDLTVIGCTGECGSLVLRLQIDDGVPAAIIVAVETAVAADPANWGKQTAHYFNADDIDDDKNVRNS